MAGRGRPRLGGLSVCETEDRRDSEAASWRVTVSGSHCASWVVTVTLRRRRRLAAALSPVSPATAPSLPAAACSGSEPEASPQAGGSVCV